MQNITRRTALTGAAAALVGVSAATPSTATDTSTIQALIDNHAALRIKEDKAHTRYEIAEKAAGEWQDSRGVELVKVSEAEHLDINQLPLDTCQKRVDRIYDDATASIRRTMHGKALSAALNAIEHQREQAHRDLENAVRAVDKAPAMAAFYQAQEAQTLAVEATDNARMQVIAHVCQHKAELFVKQEWFVKNSHYVLHGDNQEIEAIVDAYFGQLDAV